MNAIFCGAKTLASAASPERRISGSESAEDIDHAFNGEHISMPQRDSTRSAIC
ncbi:hypothetical protein RSSM_00512 [Rhodopirellula sallentina SM41]|uniref:Uncharacterized protein n=1 Tax=Rhodopirellula sallentina SM41 TaxID=1263870 RepID=M5UPR1_9BACT|nr:hypothetical protein RSSM_00512 [Rhodopirellula sallentina SM41]